MNTRKALERACIVVVTIATLEAEQAIAGTFAVEYLDVTQNTNVGFDDPTVLSPFHACGATTLGELRQCTARRALDDLGALITFAPGAAPEIRFAASFTSGGAPLGAASGFYGSTLGNPQGGLLHSHITSGTDPAAGPDATITMNFGALSNGSVVQINSDYAVIQPGVTDLYTVVLHEAIHALGVASLMSSSGASLLSSATTGPYSLFDQMLVSGGTTSPIVGGSPPSFIGPVSLLTTNAVEYYAPNTIERLPVMSPGAFLLGASLSHFDPARPTSNAAGTPYTGVHFDYVMGSGVAVRAVSEVEKDVLCDLGYDLGALCGDEFPIGIEDLGASTTPGTQVCTPVLGNDLDTDGGALIIDGVSAPTILSGAGTGAALSVSGNTICYTPPSTFVGTAAIRYRPNDGIRSGNPTLLKIPVAGTFCPDNPCNLVCNGSFEDGAPANQIGGVSTMVDCPSQCDNWCAISGTPDLMARGSPSTFNAIPHATYMNFCGTFDTWDAPNAQNNRWIQFVGGEGAYAPLVSPLVPGKSYRFRARIFAEPFATGGAGAIDVRFWTTVPGTPIQAFPLLTSPVCGWHLVDVTFVAPASPQLNYISVHGGASGKKMHVDDVLLTGAQDAIAVHMTVDQAQPKIGDSITYTIQVCNVGPNPVANVVATSTLPVGVVQTGGTFVYPSETFASLAAGACATRTLVANVTTDAPSGVPIANCVSTVGGAAQCGANSGEQCATITVPELGSICGIVWNDVDCDGVQDPSETPAAGVTVMLVRPDGSSATTISAADGTYCWNSLAAGHYGLSQTPPLETRQTFPLTPSHHIDVSPGLAVAGVAFGIAPVRRICGTVWGDTNCDAVQGGGEVGLAGRSIVLTKPDNSTMSTTTDGSGHYCFIGLDPGTYGVAQTVPAGSSQTFPTTSIHTVVVPACMSISVPQTNFGTGAQGSICGILWDDTNCDGFQNGVETGISARTITLTKPDNTTVSTTTDGTGHYCFVTLPEGTYVVAQTLPAGSAQTFPATAVHTIAMPACMVPPPPATNFGSGTQGKICGVVWGDTDCNGETNGAETGIATRTLTLTKPDNTTATTTTDAFGRYCFEELVAGTYTVAQTLPPGSAQTYPAAPVHTVEVPVCIPPGWADRDFGSVVASPLCGHIWNDLNCNRQQDGGEGSIVGRVVELTRPDGTTITTTTDLAGNYCFNSLSPGTYTVKQVPPANWVQTEPTTPSRTIVFSPCVGSTGNDFGTKQSFGPAVISTLLSTVSPWGTSGFIIMTPGTQSAVDLTTVRVLDLHGCPIEGATVTIDVSGCVGLCLDVPNGLTGVTDYTGSVRLNPRVGECATCPIKIEADGLQLALYSRVLSSDWDGTIADGRVDCADLAFFQQALTGTFDACIDFDGSTTSSLGDASIFGQSAYAGDENTVKCAPSLFQEVVIDCGGTDGAIQTTPGSITATPGQTVQWRLSGDCAELCGGDAKAKIQIDPAAGLFPAGWNSGASTLICSPVIPAGADAGTYKYTVRIEVDGDLCEEIPNNPLDPYIVVSGLIAVAPGTTSQGLRFARVPLPNPSRADMSFTLDVPEAGKIDITIYDLAGRIVTKLHRGELSAGQHAFQWRGTTDRGSRASSGYYVLRVQSRDRVLTRSLLLLQ